MITCRTLVDFLMDYLDGMLPSGQVDEFEAHLAACTACVNYLNTYKETIRLGKGAFEDLDSAVPGDVPEDLVQAILHSRQTPD